MKIQLFQVDAFANRPFAGNPAAVCPLAEWIADDVMQAIAGENNLSETAFLVAHPAAAGDSFPAFEIRWFTPMSEVDLCGHATLASAHVLFQHLGVKSGEVIFHSRHRGTLGCRQTTAGYQLNFPVDRPQPIETPAGLDTALGAQRLQCWQGKNDVLVVLPDQAAVEQLTPDFVQLGKLPVRGIIATAAGDDADVNFVSRFFAPAVGINEDPVTGSAHTVLTPYWHDRLECEAGSPLRALQLSNRGGQLTCTLDGDRVNISGQAVTYLVGEISI